MTNITRPMCPSCSGHADSRERADQRDAVNVTCPTCGHFSISGSALTGMDALTDDGRDRFRLAAAIRATSESGGTVNLTSYSVPQYIDSASAPNDVFEAIDRLISWIVQRSQSPSALVALDAARDYSIVTARNADEFRYYIEKAIALHFIERPSGSSVRLDLDGWRRVAELRKTRVRSDQAFVALWESQEMMPAWEEGIRPAVLGCGYTVRRIALVEHNEKIDDLIIAEIRRSGLMVADFSGHRPNVYFEAGFAMGLGIPVIRTCRKADIGGLHFDTRQYNHIDWESPEELAKKLSLRIQATVPRKH